MFSYETLSYPSRTFFSSADQEKFQDVSIAHDNLAQDVQEDHAHGQKKL